MSFKSFFKFLISFLPYKYKLILKYLKNFKKLPDLRKPKSFNEKVLHRIVYDKKSIYPLLADKYQVRNYIEKSIGHEYLVPIIAIYDKADELSKLHIWKNTVVKPNHGAGMVKIFDEEPSIQEKKNFIQEAKNWLEFDFGHYTGEWHYSLIQPKLIVEDKISALDESLRDYKFHRFIQPDGSFKQILQIIAERSSTGFETSFFDLNNLDYIIHSPFGYEIKLTNFEKEKILKISKLNAKICPDINYVRLDWYITSKNIYFGEITLTPGSGLSPNFGGDFGVKLGKLWMDA